MAGKKAKTKKAKALTKQDMKNLARLKVVTAELNKLASASEKLFKEKFSLAKKLGIIIRDF